MSLVSHDSIWECHYGVINELKNVTAEEKRVTDQVSEEKVDRKVNNDDVNIETSTKINDGVVDNATVRSSNNQKFKVNENLLQIHNSAENVTKSIHKNIYLEGNTDYIELTRINHKKNFKERSKINTENISLQNVITEKEDVKNNNKIIPQQICNNDGNKTVKRNSLRNAIVTPFWKTDCASNALHGNKRKLKWKINSGVLISLIVLNVAGLSSADDTSTFASSLTSRMIASFLGYPSTCSLGNEVRPCTLTLTCWLRGGTRLRGCGGWLFSCCGAQEPSREDLDNSIPSSEWKYKPPTKLRQVPQRSVLPNNVFRRRVDDDVTQMECGLPSSRILQKRIIGGREARFAEFPWQAHVRISEFQCGGVLVSHRYVATAAHCVSRAHTRDIAVWLGAIDTSATHHPARKLGVIQKILHPLFQFRMTQPDRYDIALLKLSRPITYMSHILPICLPDGDLDLRGRSGVIAGWGKTDASNGHTGTNLLRSATVPILSKEQCINWHQSKQISVEIHSEMICAGHSDGHQDACLGDSGGPLIVFDNGRYYLVGITSAGFGCGVDHQPGIYHNVKLTANWIRSVISPPVTYNDNYLK